jgi:glycosyltransferase involved in cell wall biosynthesis
MKIAVIHDYFTQLGGAEKVAEELYRMLPDPSLFATVAFPDCMPGQLKDVLVRTSWMQNLPGIERYYRLYFLLYPLAVSDLDLSEYDLVLSSSSGYAKGVQTGRDAIHVCYCHTPMRWVWSFDNYSQRESFRFGTRTFLPMLIRALKLWDQGASRQPDHFVANSKVVADRILRAYGRSAEVIHPPIDTSRFPPTGDPPEDFYLVLSRLVSYKRIDLAVRVCSALGKKLVVIGYGPNREALEAIAGPTVTFLGRASDADVEYLVPRCRALLFPGEEDFGMAPLEVAAAGRPTIAYRAGGALETIVENQTGVFFDHQTPEDLANAIEHFERQQWNPDLLATHAESFSVPVFQERFHSFLRRIGVPLQTTPPLLRSSTSDAPQHVFAAHA